MKQDGMRHGDGEARLGAQRHVAVIFDSRGFMLVEVSSTPVPASPKWVRH